MVPVGCCQDHDRPAVVQLEKFRREVLTLIDSWPVPGPSGYVATSYWESPATGGVTLSAQSSDPSGGVSAQVSLGTGGLVYSVVNTVVTYPSPTGGVPSTRQQAYQVYVRPYGDPLAPTPCGCP